MLRAAKRRIQFKSKIDTSTLSHDRLCQSLNNDIWRSPAKLNPPLNSRI